MLATRTFFSHWGMLSGQGGLQLLCTQSVFCERVSKHQAVHVGSPHTAVPKIMSGSAWNVSLFISWGSVGERNGVLGSFEHS